MKRPFHVGPPSERWAPNRFTPDRQPQAYFEAREGIVRIAGFRELVVPNARRRGGEKFSQLLDQAGEPGFVALEVLYLATLLA